MKRLAFSLLSIWVVASIIFSTRRQSDRQELGQSKLAKLTLSTTQPISVRPVAIAAPPESPTYVGRDACKECHQDNHAWHGKHGHHKTSPRRTTLKSLNYSKGGPTIRVNPMERLPIMQTNKGSMRNCRKSLGIVLSGYSILLVQRTVL